MNADRPALQRLLLNTVRRLRRVEVQNRLMACTDRDLALAILDMEDSDARTILATVSPKKAARVREEEQLHDARHVESTHVVAALLTVIRSLETGRLIPGQRSYLRPRRSRPN